jgi:hypothetical protein
MRTYRVRDRSTLIEQRNQNSLTHLLKSKGLTLEAKTTLINERNPYLHAFGTPLTTQRYEETYTDWVSRQYIGSPDHITSIEEARQYIKTLMQEVAHG